MQPDAITIFGYTIRTYGIFAALAVSVVYLLSKRASKKIGIDFRSWEALFFPAMLFAIIGARILYVLSDLSFYLDNPIEIIRIDHGGLVWYGGFLGAIGYIFIKAKKDKGCISLLDFTAPYIALGHAIARIGCFFNGCCYGIPSRLLGVQFPHLPEPVIPTQLIESGYLFLLFAILAFYRKRYLNDRGVLTMAYVLGYSIFRFFIEFIRGDARPYFLHVSLSQWISLGLILVVLWALRQRRNRRYGKADDKRK